jgi:hypothetical protein
MHGDASRRFILNLWNISVGSAYPSRAESQFLMSTKISTLIDSSSPYLYLPEDVCDHFELILGLQFNTTSQIYTINNTMHDTLMARDFDITFTIANDQSQTIDIRLPYEAFDLNASFPVSSENTRYFPLKRATNPSQYTLGRVFFQEA